MNEFETAGVYESSVFQPLKFFCNDKDRCGSMRKIPFSGNWVHCQGKQLSHLHFCPRPLLMGICSAKNKRKLYDPLSILFYPITLEGLRGTTDEFATIPFRLVLFSAALVELAKSIPCPLLDIVFPPLLLSASFSFSFHRVL